MQAQLARLAAARWKGLGAVVLFGGFAALGQAPLSLYPLTIIALAIGMAVIGAAQTGWRAFALGVALGTGYFAGTWTWIVEPFLVDIKRHGWMAPFALLFLSAGVALFWGAAFALAHQVRPASRWAAMALAVGIAEWVRGWIFTGFSWGGPGLIWIDTPMAQLARYVGVLGLSIGTLLLAGGLMRVSMRRDLSEFRRLQAWPWVVGVFAFVGLGFLADHRAVPARQDAPIVRLVQPNAPQHQKWDPAHVMTFFERAEALSRAETEPRPDVVIWPETSIPALLGQVPELEARAIAAAAPAPLVVGIQRRNGPTYHNSLVAFGSDAAPLWIYDKHHLVPFGEYVPLGNLMGRLGIRGMAQQEGFGYSSGPGPMVLPLPGALGDVLPLICYEAIFTRDVRGSDRRPDWILQATNDAWFGTFSGPQQHLAQARFRAIEMGLPLARAANTGISAMIDAKGNVTQALALGEAGFVDAPLPAAFPTTVFAVLGEWVIALVAALGLGALLLFARSKSFDA